MEPPFRYASRNRSHVVLRLEQMGRNNMVMARWHFGFPSRLHGECAGQTYFQFSKNGCEEILSLYKPFHFSGKIG
jgi:hypothetical protein